MDEWIKRMWYIYIYMHKFCIILLFWALVSHFGVKQCQNIGKCHSNLWYFNMYAVCLIYKNRMLHCLEECELWSLTSYDKIHYLSFIINSITLGKWPLPLVFQSSLMIIRVSYTAYSKCLFIRYIQSLQNSGLYNNVLCWRAAIYYYDYHHHQWV